VLCACIDIGSNTTRLLVADADHGRLREVLQQRAFTRLGATAEISARKVSEVAESVAHQVRLARECGADRIRAVGTHALRQAANREDLLSRIEEAAGIEVDVLTGEEEARYAFLGATHTLRDAPDGDVAVVDVGGGSTELVCGTLADGVSWSASLHVGSGSLTDTHVASDPADPADLERVRRHVAGVFAGVEAPRPRAAYAVGGSATSLRRLVGAVLDHESLDRGVRALASRPSAQVAERLELHPERVRLLPAGMLLLAAASDALGAPLEVAAGGLREGVLLEELRLGRLDADQLLQDAGPDAPRR
jgi:exopolyphosphatase/guanosine-5'-triphosphate,3'-diphosphate pyrophosphatase